ncbi:nuclear pore complex protein Nup88-like isoform X2 [Acanthaster planci]|uniref:Nuclear pore complex protein Nup88-like isoform X2 n=1 Tax=Acanthaster planci TaxID=133434 RepID=A0A8B7ZVU2_ACAPL|nr:nuclear pore complex protein Nup88-like isoform X2 [Acanthaster planci]
MAAFPDEDLRLELWRKSLNAHPVFESLRSYDKHEPQRTEPENLLVVQEGQLFAWDSGESRLLTMNLKDLLDYIHADDVHSCNRRLQEVQAFQKLLCTNTPRFDIEHIELSTTGRHVLLWGTKGASVMTLPRRHGQFGQFEGGKEQINCRTVILAERFFMSSGTLRLLQAAWYPGSDSDIHVVLLTSDNTLRVYDVTSPHKPIQCHRLGEYSTSYSLSANRSTFEVALGDIAVAFDFGPVMEEPTKIERRSNAPPPLLYPVYILKGNGDVFLLKTSLSEPRYVHTNLQGPLTMHPPAEDNYGLDACSILCLHTSPIVLVVATSGGILHHCIVLTGDDEDDNDNHSVTSASISDIGSVRGKSDFALYVYESVELSLTVLSKDYPEDTAYPILLHKDPSSPCQYYCSHSAGVHCVTLSWLQKLTHYCSSEYEGNEEGSVMDVVNQDESCTVAHMICTKPSESCPPAPILGLTVVADHLLGQALLCRTSTNDCIVTPLKNDEMPPPPPLLSEEDTHESESSLKQLSSEPFQNRIRKILLRNVSNPILKGSSKTSLSPEESFDLVCSATKVLREEYISKQDLARDDIEKRVKILQQQKELQKTDLQDCNRLKEEIHNQAQQIAFRHDDALEKQQDLLERVGAALHALQGQLPVLSEAEQNLQKEMTDMEQKVEQLKDSLKKVKLKDEYRRKKMQELDKKEQSPSLSQGQNRHLKTLLKEESDTIASLVKEIKNLTVAVGH